MRPSFRILGGLEVRSPHPPLDRLEIQPKRLALLVYLLLARPLGPHQRDKLVALFWPELDSGHARNSLSKALQVLRDQLGEGLIETVGASEVLARSDVITVDAIEFEKAVVRGQLETALALYQGDLLDGFHLGGVSGFEQWLEHVRREFRELALSAARQLACEKLDAGLFAEAVRWTRWAASRSGHDETQIRQDLQLLARAGDRAGALELYRRFAEHLRQEFDAEPSARTRLLREEIRNRPLVAPDAVHPPQTSSSFPHDPPDPALAPARTPLGARWGWVVPILAMVVAAGLLSGRPGGSAAGAAPIELGAIRPLTSDSGLEIQPAISPDGSLVVYVAGPAAEPKLFLRAVSGGVPVPLTPSLPGSQSPAWSPDGSRILFDRGGSIYVVDPRGGRPLVMVQAAPDQVFREPAWAPNGKEIAYIANRRTILISPVSGGPARLVVQGSDLHSPSWSPDGRLLAYATGNPQFARAFYTLGNLAPAGIMVVPAAGGTAVEVTDRVALRTSPLWTPDGRHLLFVSSEAGTRDVFVVPVDRDGRPSGPTRRLTTGLSAGTISLSSRAGLMAFSEFHNTANLWLLTLAHGVAGPRGAPVLLTTGTEHVEFVAVSPDGRWLAFDSDRNGFPNLYRMRVTGSEPERLTTEATFDFAPSWSPDGEEIAFHSWRRGSRDILVIPSRGGPAQPVVQWKSHEFYPDWSPDGRTLVFESDRTGRRELYLVARDSAGKWDQPRQLTHEGGSVARWSPTGPWIAYAGGRYGLQLMHLGEAVAPRELLSPANWPADRGAVSRVDWSRDGDTVYFNVFDASEAVSYWAIPAVGGHPRLLARFEHEPIYQEFALRDDRLYFTIDNRGSDIKLIEVDQIRR